MRTLSRYSLFLLLAVVGCDSASVTDPALVIETDEARYTPSDTVTVAFTNGRSASLFLGNDGCTTFGKPLPNMRVERQEQTGWVRYALDFGCGAVAQPPTELAPDEPYQVQLRTGLVRDLPPGTYRYVFGILEAEDEQGPVSQDERTSNVFVVAPTLAATTRSATQFVRPLR